MKASKLKKPGSSSKPLQDAKQDPAPKKISLTEKKPSKKLLTGFRSKTSTSLSGRSSGLGDIGDAIKNKLRVNRAPSDFELSMSSPSQTQKRNAPRAASTRSRKAHLNRERSRSFTELLRSSSFSSFGQKARIGNEKRRDAIRAAGLPVSTNREAEDALPYSTSSSPERKTSASRVNFSLKSECVPAVQTFSLFSCDTDTDHPERMLYGSQSLPTGSLRSPEAGDFPECLVDAPTLIKVQQDSAASEDTVLDDNVDPLRGQSSEKSSIAGKCGEMDDIGSDVGEQERDPDSAEPPCSKEEVLQPSASSIKDKKSSLQSSAPQKAEVLTSSAKSGICSFSAHQQKDQVRGAASSSTSVGSKSVKSPAMQTSSKIKNSIPKKTAQVPLHAGNSSVRSSGGQTPMKSLTKPLSSRTPSRPVASAVKVTPTEAASVKSRIAKTPVTNKADTTSRVRSAPSCKASQKTPEGREFSSIPSKKATRSLVRVESAVRVRAKDKSQVSTNPQTKQPVHPSPPSTKGISPRNSSASTTSTKEKSQASTNSQAKKTPPVTPPSAADSIRRKTSALASPTRATSVSQTARRNTQPQVTIPEVRQKTKVTPTKPGKGARSAVSGGQSERMTAQAAPAETVEADALRQKITELTEELAASTSRWTEQFEAEHAKHLAAIESVQEKQKELDALQTNFEALQLAKNEADACIAAMEEAHAAEITRDREEHDEKLALNEQTWTAAVNEVSQSCQFTIDSLKQTHEAELETMKEAVDDMTSQFQATCEERDDLASKLAAFQVEKNEAAVQTESSDNQVASLLAEVQSLEVVVGMKSTEMKDLRRQKMELEQKVEELATSQRQADAARARNEELQAQVEHLKTLQRSAEAEAQTFRERSEDLDKSHQQLVREKEELQWLLQTPQRDAPAEDGDRQTPHFNGLERSPPECQSTPTSSWRT